MKFTCILLAAGASQRMGQNKLMMNVAGKPVILRTVEEILNFDFEEVLVVVGNEQDKIMQALSTKEVRFLYNENFHLGMHTSIKAGLRGMQKESDAFFICQADQPYFSHQTLKKLMAAAKEDNQKIHAPYFQQRQGNPVLLSSEFKKEILEHEDGDFGCHYLFKRYPQEVKKVEMESASVLMDMDTPDQYERVLRDQSLQVDPVTSVMSKALELKKANETFAQATVIEVMGSSSARVGSKAIFSRKGKNLVGWIGGGCAERFVSDQCLEAIEQKQSRIITADLDDEVFGLGIDCGGKMKIFIEPFLPAQKIQISCPLKFRNSLLTLAGFYGIQLSFKDEIKDEVREISFEQTIVALAKEMASTRGKSFKSLRDVKNVPAKFTSKQVHSNKQVVLIGKSRITEALQRHFSLLNYSVKNAEASDDLALTFSAGDVVIVASHTAQDPLWVESALNSEAAYVGMIGSIKRSREVLTHLDKVDSIIEEPLYIPVGVDIDARNPEEIALSVLAEYLVAREGLNE